ncbi:MAG TPA: 3TM-type holin [Alphaproteobacteria bacterium]|nr:ribokinase [Rhodospirillaceae bacterium]HRJ12153.1 3TM-type holin [Alphaproteobacteria bacterium]
MLPAIIAGIGLPLLLDAAREGLKKIDHPIARTAVDALTQLGHTMQTGGITLEQLKEANRHIEAMARIEGEENKTALQEVNKSLREEVKSPDAYVRRMRATFGYILAFSWGILMSSVAYTIVVSPSEAGRVMAGMSDLSAIWGVGLAVLGIYVYRKNGMK